MTDAIPLTCMWARGVDPRSLNKDKPFDDLIDTVDHYKRKKYLNSTTPFHIPFIDLYNSQTSNPSIRPPTIEYYKTGKEVFFNLTKSWVANQLE